MCVNHPLLVEKPKCPRSRQGDRFQSTFREILIMQIEEIHFDTIDSTNDYAKREYLSFSPDGLTCIAAESQTAGRGRYLRKWISPPHVNLLATFCFRLKLQTSHVTCLAQILSYSLSSLLLKDNLEPKIKWPNDVLLGGKKVAGVLCETIFTPSFIQIILGIGVNVNMDRSALELIDQPATSLSQETGRTWNVKAVLHRLQMQWIIDLMKFKQEGFAPFHAPIEGLLAYKGETIRFFDGAKEWTGVCQGLTAEGQLILRLPDGTVHMFYSGKKI